jgi:hypothetical protein
LVIVLGALAGFALVWYAVQGEQQPVFDATLEGAYPDISRAMQAVAATTPDGASMSSGDLFRIVTRSGFRRLGDQSVLEFVQLRANLAQTDDAATCAELCLYCVLMSNALSCSTRAGSVLLLNSSRAVCALAAPAIARIAIASKVF